ncbi:MAG: hypothetical protein LHW56_01425 [Candidatus Cloacimonetes bacterium]|nr:hypothetical protein [Candidatus Cloacimonadota bacterium]MDY0171547.1 hypothetical protein [Candidatus Cloacimonadaceae bacterium]
MINKLLGGIALTVMLLTCISCTKVMRLGYRITGTVSEEGQWRKTAVKELLPEDIYVSDQLVIRCSRTLSTSAPFTETASDPPNTAWTRIIPDTLVIKSGDKISVDTEAEMIYFCANNDLYSCNYKGENLINHSPDLDLNLSQAILSADRRYITMLSYSLVFGTTSLNRYDLQTGEFLHVWPSFNVTWAAYNPDLDRFYYFSSWGSLHSCNSDGSDDLEHFEGILGESWGYCRSNGDRYIGSFTKPASGAREGMVFDISTGEISQIENLDRMAFNPCKNELTYSIRFGAKSELRRRNLDDGSEIQIHNGHVKKPDTVATYVALNYRQDGKATLFTANVATPLTASLYDD